MSTAVKTMSTSATIEKSGRTKESTPTREGCLVKTCRRKVSAAPVIFGDEFENSFDEFETSYVEKESLLLDEWKNRNSLKDDIESKSESEEGDVLDCSRDSITVAVKDDSTANHEEFGEIRSIHSLRRMFELDTSMKRLSGYSSNGLSTPRKRTKKVKWDGVEIVISVTESIGDLKQENGRKDKEIRSLLEELDEFTSKLASKDKSIQNHERLLEDSERTIKQLRTAGTELEEELEIIRDDVKCTRSKLSEANVEIASLTEKLIKDRIEFETKDKALSAAKREWQREQKKLNTELCDNQATIIKVEKKMTKFTKESDTTIQNLKDELGEKEIKFAKMKQEFVRLMDDYTASKFELGNRTETIAELTGELVTAAEKYALLEKRCQELSKKKVINIDHSKHNAELKSENCHIKKKNQELKDSIRAMRDEKKKHHANLKSSKASAKTEIKTMMLSHETQLDQFKINMDNYMQIIDDLKHKISTKDEEIELTKENSQTVITRHVQKINQLNSSLQNFEHDVESLKATISTLKSNKNQQQKDYNHLYEKFEIMLAEFNKQKGVIQSSQTQLEKVEADLFNAKEDASRSRTEESTHHQEYISSKKEYDSLILKLRELENKPNQAIVTLRRRVEEHNKELVTVRGLCAERLKKITVLKSQLQQHSDDLLKYKKYIRSVVKATGEVSDVNVKMFASLNSSENSLNNWSTPKGARIGIERTALRTQHVHRAKSMVKSHEKSLSITESNVEFSSEGKSGGMNIIVSQSG